jgi:hypothetical protein
MASGSASELEYQILLAQNDSNSTTCLTSIPRIFTGWCATSFRSPPLKASARHEEVIILLWKTYFRREKRRIRQTKVFIRREDATFPFSAPHFASPAPLERPHSMPEAARLLRVNGLP